jgi:hypothetical protein
MANWQEIVKDLATKTPKKWIDDELDERKNEINQWFKDQHKEFVETVEKYKPDTQPLGDALRSAKFNASYQLNVWANGLDRDEAKNAVKHAKLTVGALMTRHNMLAKLPVGVGYNYQELMLGALNFQNSQVQDVLGVGRLSPGSEPIYQYYAATVIVLIDKYRVENSAYKFMKNVWVSCRNFDITDPIEVRRVQAYIKEVKENPPI